jgi:hypothetical protein
LRVVSVANWHSNAVVDRELITGQQPISLGDHDHATILPVASTRVDRRSAPFPSSGRRALRPRRRFGWPGGRSVVFGVAAAVARRLIATSPNARTAGHLRRRRPGRDGGLHQQQGRAAARRRRRRPGAKGHRLVFVSGAFGHLIQTGACINRSGGNFAWSAQADHPGLAFHAARKRRILGLRPG